MADALPNIVLPKPQVLLWIVDSPDAWFEPAGVSLNWGEVKQVFATSDRTNVGDIVFFETAKATPIQYSARTFYLINEEDLGFAPVIIP